MIASVLVYVITWATFHLSAGDGDDEKIGPEDARSFQVLDFNSSIIFPYTSAYIMYVTHMYCASFQIVVAAGLGIGIICSILFHAVVKEAPATGAEVDQTTSANGSTVSPAGQGVTQKTVKEHLSSVRLYQVAAVYMCTRLYANLTQVSSVTMLFVVFKNMVYVYDMNPNRWS